MTKTRYIPLPGAGGGEVVLQGLQATQNITYRPGPGVTGFDQVDVNVPASEVDQGTKQDTISQNGTQTIDVVGYAGHEITVDVPNGVQGLQATQNGTYRPTSPNIGFDVVEVNVPASEVDSGTKQTTISQNGTQTINVVGYAGHEVTVEVPNGVQGLQATQNGTYRPTSPNIGFDVVEVNVPASEVDSGTLQQTISQNGVQTINVVGYANIELDVQVGGGADPNYLYIENVDQNDRQAQVVFGNNGSDYTDFTLYTSTDKTNWTRMTQGITIPVNGKVYFYGENTNPFNQKTLSITGGNVNVGGDVTTLMTKPGNQLILQSHQFRNLFYGDNTIIDASHLEIPAKIVGERVFQFMFRDCTSLVNPPTILPATNIGGNCYQGMFYGCTSLTSAPTLPATSINISCYQEMFRGCTALVNAPALPALRASSSCYQGMFYGCTSLTSAPALPATTLLQNCYGSMFEGCTSLVNAPALNSTSLGNSSYANMFKGCTSLANIPAALPATTLAVACYNNMFRDCTSLTTIPSGLLPATTLISSCYSHMFDGCTSLTTIPSGLLPATNIADTCYNAMFMGCTSLTTVPSGLLPATTLYKDCYNSMFRGTSLTASPILPATSLNASSYKYMFQGCASLTSITCLLEVSDPTASEGTLGWVSGVAASGTFTKSANMSTWPTGTSGIPSGWTVQDYVA